MIPTQPAARQAPPRKKLKRLTRSSDYRRAYRQGEKATAAFLRVYFAQNALTYPRLGVVVSSRISKKAAERNWHKRVIKEWFRQHNPHLPTKPSDIVVVVIRNASAESRGSKALRKELEQLTNQPVKRI